MVVHKAEMLTWMVCPVVNSLEQNYGCWRNCDTIIQSRDLKQHLYCSLKIKSLLVALGVFTKHPDIQDLKRSLIHSTSTASSASKMFPVFPRCFSMCRVAHVWWVTSIWGSADRPVMLTAAHNHWHLHSVDEKNTETIIFLVRSSWKYNVGFQTGWDNQDILRRKKVL